MWKIAIPMVPAVVVISAAGFAARLYGLPTEAMAGAAPLSRFNKQHPGDADYVIVPAMSRDDDPGMMALLKDQAAKGALVIGICAGVKAVASAGLLDGKRATTRWYYLDELRGRHPSIFHAADRRIVVDQRVATTTGISASMPIALTSIEAIGTYAAAPDKSRSGMRIVPDTGEAAAPSGAAPLALTDWPPANLLDDTLSAIGQRYEERTAEVVAMQLEYLKH